MNRISKLPVGLRRHPYRWIGESAMVCLGLWKGIDLLSHFIPLKPSGLLWLLALIGASILIGLWRALPMDSLRARLGGSNTYLTARFGDLFGAKGVRVIPVNELFYGALGDQVSPKSLHGKLIASAFGGSAAAFDSVVGP